MRDWRQRDAGEETGEVYPTGVKPGVATLTSRLPVQRKASSHAPSAEATPPPSTPFGFVRAYEDAAAAEAPTRAAGAPQFPDQVPDLWLASGGAGEPLPGALRERFENHLGTDLGSVRLHTGADAAHAASSISARGYTVGQDVYFAAGEYQPETSAGQELIAHEVVHTVQQASGQVPIRQDKLAIGSADDPLEREADAIAGAMVRDEPGPTTISRAAPRISRWVTSPDEAVQGRVAIERAIAAGPDAERERIASALEHARAAATSSELVRIQAGGRDVAVAPPDIDPLINEARRAIGDNPATIAGRDTIRRAIMSGSAAQLLQIREALSAASYDRPGPIYPVHLPTGQTVQVSGSALEELRAECDARARTLPQETEGPDGPRPAAPPPRRAPPPGDLVEFDLEQPSPDRARQLREQGIQLPTVSAESADPRQHSQYVDRRLEAVGFSIYIGGYVLYLSGMDQPVFVAERYFDFASTEGTAASTAIHDSYDQAQASVHASNQFAFYRSLGVIAPTVFSRATTPNVIATALEARRALAEHVISELTGVAIGLVAQILIPLGLGALSRVGGRGGRVPHLEGGGGGRTRAPEAETGGGGGGSRPPNPEPAGGGGGGSRPPQPEGGGGGGGRGGGRAREHGPGDPAESSRVRDQRERAVEGRRPPMTEAQTQMSRRLVDEHPNLSQRVADDAVQGGESVGGAGVAGADVRLLNGGGREVSVHSGAFTDQSMARHLQEEAAQAGTTEIYMQVQTGTREGMIRMAHSLRNGYRELDGIMVRFYGPSGEQWWEGMFRFRGE